MGRFSQICGCLRGLGPRALSLELQVPSERERERSESGVRERNTGIYLVFFLGGTLLLLL